MSMKPIPFKVPDGYRYPADEVGQSARALLAGYR
ncbi:MAG: hypothetical protein GAK43_02563 [Stenotrophomonas maltophilia]|nr:MAG: hypothetical protein GAK43_02563 [Stenotrophomonas maltophilia]